MITNTILYIVLYCIVMYCIVLYLIVLSCSHTITYRQPVPAECSFGGTVQFECEGESYELISYQWYKDDDKLVGEDKNVLKLTNLTLENTGNYHCVVSTSVMREKSYVVRLR